MPDNAASAPLPASLDRVLRSFRVLSREDKMQTLVSWSKKLEPLPPELAALDRAQFTVPECQTRVDLFPHFKDGKLHFYADVDPKTSPTIAAFLAITFSAVNGQPPAVTLAIPPDFVRTMMENIGLGTREVGLSAMIARMQNHARQAAARTPPPTA